MDRCSGWRGRILFWLAPSRDARYRNLYRGLRILGLLMLIAVFAIFRRTTAAGNVRWIDGSYPEILGLIGYTYFAVALLYVPTRRWRWMPLAWFAALRNSLRVAHGTPARVSMLCLFTCGRSTPEHGRR